MKAKFEITIGDRYLFPTGPVDDARANRFRDTLANALRGVLTEQFPEYADAEVVVTRTSGIDCVTHMSGDLHVAIGRFAANRAFQVARERMEAHDAP